MNNTLKNDFAELLKKYQSSIDEQITSALSTFGHSGVLHQACSYALSSGGKRLRPAVVLMIADSIGKGANALPAALAIEFFHTASLIADDLPCMDNDSERRNKPSLHKIYGEATALLASYGLIAAGYQALSENSKLLVTECFVSKEEAGVICQMALENTSYNTGLFGATGGQQLDLFPPDHSLETLIEVIEKKTISLFELAFVLGWLFGKGDISLLSTVKKAAYSLGMAFQVADDLADLEQDISRGSVMNMAILLGKEKAREIVTNELTSYSKHIETLGIKTFSLEALAATVAKLA